MENPNYKISPMLNDIWFWEGKRLEERIKALHKVKIIAIDDDSLVMEFIRKDYNIPDPKFKQLYIKDFLKNATFEKESKSFIKSILSKLNFLL